MATKPARKMTRDELSVRDDKCPRCGGELDTGWECNRCGFDAFPIALLINRNCSEKLH